MLQILPASKSRLQQFFMYSKTINFLGYYQSQCIWNCCKANRYYFIDIEDVQRQFLKCVRAVNRFSIQVPYLI